LAVAGDTGVTLLDMRGRRLWYRDLAPASRLWNQVSAVTSQMRVAGRGWDEKLTSLTAKATSCGRRTLALR